MKAFCISEEQIALVIGGLVADELSWRFKRHVDFLTVASWTGETPIGPGGLGLGDGDERRACEGRIRRFFNLVDVSTAPAEIIGDWAHIVARAVLGRMTAFAFTAAGRDSATESSVHPADDIYADAPATANLLYGRRRLVSFVSPHSLMGFVTTTLTANLQGVPHLDARLIAPDALAGRLAFGDVVVATPTLWRYLMREGVAAPDNAMAVSFGEPLAPELASDLRKAGFGALRELYGSTETGVLAWRDSPGEPFVLFDHWTRSKTGLARRRASGELRDVAAMDAIEWTSERLFRLGGRRDGAVQVGAVNVIPERIAAVIAGHRAIDACRIEVMREKGGVNRLVARIVLKRGVVPGEALARDLDQWCRAQLRPQERPRIYNIEEEI